MAKKVVHIGMDLGSSKTSVVCSNGRRAVLPTAVGWPKDYVARGLLGRDVIFGKDIREHRRVLNVIQPFQKGVLKYLSGADAGISDEQLEKHVDAAKLIVEYAVSLMDLPQGIPVYGVIGAPGRASTRNKQNLLEASKEAFDAVAIVSEPFTVAYGMMNLTDTLVVDIGAGTVDICPIYGMYPSDEEQVTIPMGGDLVDEEFHKRIQQAFPKTQLSLNMAREIKEKYGFVHDVNESVVVTLTFDGRPLQFDVAEPLKEACKTMVSPIVQGLREAIARLDPEYQQRMLQNIVLGGGGSQLVGLDRLIEGALDEYGGAKVTKVYDSVFAGAVGALKLAMGMPSESWNEIKAAA